MAWRNSDTEWGGVSKTFHWTMAALIIVSSIFVLHINGTTPWFKSGPAIYIHYIHWHKSLGLIALALVVGRILWRRSQAVPRTAPLTPFEDRASRWTHRGLYALMIAVPVTGWIASSAFGSKTNFFGLFKIPGIWPKDKAMVAIGYWVHYALAWAILTVVAIHAIAALYHHFHRKDDVLRAMWPGRRPPPAGG